MIAIAIAAALTATVVSLGILFGLLRRKAYRERVRYNPRQNFHLGIAGSRTQAIRLDADASEILLPKSLGGALSGFLELQVRASALGGLFDPAIEIRSGAFSDMQYLERGARGTRFLNISRLLNSKGRGESLQLVGRRVSWSSEGIWLYACDESVASNDRVLVIAPHPDDAEIAAHGLYAELRATVVTLTAGDASELFQGARSSSIRLSRNLVASLRVWDSITVPQHSGLSSEQAVNLCMPDGRLMEMFQCPDRDFQLDNEALAFLDLRRMNRSSLVLQESTCTWASLVRELGCIIEEVKPNIVVCPHPSLDPHPDHLFSAVAICEALKCTGATVGRMFFYTVHNCRTELWPFGPAGSGVPLLPILIEDGVCASGFYSHPLSTEAQQRKFVALEAMHGLRQIQLPVESSTRRLFAEIVAELRGWAHGMGRAPKSYLRRAVRPDELFFVTSFEEGIKLTDWALRQKMRRSKA